MIENIMSSPHAMRTQPLPLLTLGTRLSDTSCQNRAALLPYLHAGRTTKRRLQSREPYHSPPKPFGYHCICIIACPVTIR